MHGKQVNNREMTTWLPRSQKKPMGSQVDQAFPYSECRLEEGSSSAVGVRVIWLDSAVSSFHGILLIQVKAGLLSLGLFRSGVRLAWSVPGHSLGNKSRTLKFKVVPFNSGILVS
ncbi:hypothetical protein Nepgr_007272 [Nepenthes gracilis]|uniref:Uncharacterized protein n=1 Tax=Nepenthes gracilis TaxID=150966 RepID=A0AAD3S7G8_NEPGR|nr:hypothetical protein Nepgr_007272 [Nepenthes gracilis]